MQNVWKQLRGVLVVGIAMVVMAGCAGNLRGMIGAASQEQVDIHTTDIKNLKTTKADNARVDSVERKVTALAADQVKTAGLLKETADALKGVAGTVQVHGTAITDINGRLAKADDWAKSVVKALGGLRTTANRAMERTGVLADIADVGDGDIVKIGPFPLAKYDEKEDKFTACAEMSDAMKKQAEAATKRIKDDSREIEKVVGAADVRPFRGKDAKALANSDDLNGECATLRAQAVAEALGFDKDKAIGRGPTARYGEPYDANRTVRIYLKKK